MLWSICSMVLVVWKFVYDYYVVVVLVYFVVC